ncbi:alkaline phosphatase family protein [Halorubrum aidingense]|uniref:alkaline phosphatase family protein n=1 Tax=Halorubrum aidingense TaxID=368623 RepID=UPI0009B5CC15|nr:alkaline phosphatase family protein [Halorubrum aidingense]
MQLLIVGLDGLSWNILEEFDIEPDYLSAVADKGINGHLHSVDTPTTLPAWTSFATGKDPGTHGLTNMISQKENYETKAPSTNTSDIAAYDLLDNSLFVNLPASIDRIPAAENTHLVSSFDAEGPADAVPEELQSLPAFENYRTMQNNKLKSQPNQFVDDLVQVANRRAEFTEQAISKTDPRVCFVLFSVTDWLGHILGNAANDKIRAGWVRQVMNSVDSHVKQLSSNAENVLLMSDHGFERKHANLHLNNYLSEQGYLEETESEDWQISNFVVGLAQKLAGRSDRLYQLMRHVYNRVIGYRIMDGVKDAADFDIQYSTSQAWELRFGSIHINDNFFDQPTVDDVEGLQEELIADLESLTYEGEQVFREVLRSEEAYDNPKRGVPSVIARPAKGIFPLMFQSPTGEIITPTDTFEHRYRGIIAAEGPLFEDQVTVENMSIEDILPTTLHALRSSVPNDMTGEVRDDILQTDRQIVTSDTDSMPEPRTRNSNINRNTEERLADLGYI